MDQLKVVENDTNFKFIWKYKNQLYSKKIKKRVLFKEIEEFRMKKNIPQSVPYNFVAYGRDVLLIYNFRSCTFIRRIQFKQENYVSACTISYFFIYMFTAEIIRETIKITVVRMTTNDDLNSTAVQNLLQTGRLQKQLQIDLEEAFSKYLQIKDSGARLSKIFDEFSKIRDPTISQLTDMLVSEFDKSIKEGFSNTGNSKLGLIFIFLLFLIIIPLLIRWVYFEKAAAEISIL